MAEKLSGLSSAAETERSVEKLVEKVYYKNIASAAVFEDSILAEANAVKVERSRSGVEDSQIMWYNVIILLWNHSVGRR